MPEILATRNIWKGLRFFFSQTWIHSLTPQMSVKCAITKREGISRRTTYLPLTPNPKILFQYVFFSFPSPDNASCAIFIQSSLTWAYLCDLESRDPGLLFQRAERILIAACGKNEWRNSNQSQCGWFPKRERESAKYLKFTAKSVDRMECLM